jgi:cytosine/adenosine deaminase-related metal-dependent hydrolase
LKALINASIYDFHSYHENSYVLFEDDIKEVGSMANFKGADEVFDCRGSVIMPGLVNCHTHIYSTFSRGMNVPFNPRNFMDILEQLWWKLDSKLDCGDVYSSAATVHEGPRRGLDRMSRC